jgi:hypothetical protein
VKGARALPPADSAQARTIASRARLSPRALAIQCHPQALSERVKDGGDVLLADRFPVFPL